MNEGWVQFLLVAVPVLSLVGSWLALRAVAGRKARKDAPEQKGEARNG
jgi:hypothetical protein